MTASDISRMAVLGTLPPPTGTGYCGPWGYSHSYPCEETAGARPGDIWPSVQGPYGRPAIVVTGVDDETGEVYGRYIPAEYGM